MVDVTRPMVDYYVGQVCIFFFSNSFTTTVRLKEALIVFICKLQT